MTRISTAPSWNKTGQRPRSGALVLVEMLVVLLIIGMITSAGMLSLSAISGQSRFIRQGQRLVGVFQSAYDAAQQSDRRYAVVLYFADQNYVLRQFVSLDFEGIAENESILREGSFNDNFQLDYVLYDDLEDTRELGQTMTEARFYAGHSGWQCGGKVVLRDRDGQPWSILVYRMGKPVELVKGDVPILLPQKSNELSF